jgi:hypothetical protein
MKLKVILSTLVWCVLIIHSDGLCQEEKKLVYKAFILTESQTYRTAGILQEVRDSSIIITSKKKEIEIRSDQILEIKIRRKGAVGRSAGNGAIVGLGTGVIAGFISGGDNPDNLFAYSAGEKAVIFGLILSAPGALVGSIFGMSYKEKIKINFNQTIFQDKKLTLKKYENSYSDKK